MTAVIPLINLCIMLYHVLFISCLSKKQAWKPECHMQCQTFTMKTTGSIEHTVCIIFLICVHGWQELYLKGHKMSYKSSPKKTEGQGSSHGSPAMGREHIAHFCPSHYRPTQRGITLQHINILSFSHSVVSYCMYFPVHVGPRTVLCLNTHMLNK